MFKYMLPALPLGGDRLRRFSSIEYEELQRRSFSLLAATDFLEDQSPHTTFCF
jgi:hypothetical protein